MDVTLFIKPNTYIYNLKSGLPFVYLYYTHTKYF